jgi:hypothetical protein
MQFLCLARRQAQPSSGFSASPELDLGHQLHRESRRQPLCTSIAHIEGRLGKKPRQDFRINRARALISMNAAGNLDVITR